MTTKAKPTFKKINRFDATKASKGVAHTFTDELNNVYPVWTTSLFDIHNKFLKVENDRYLREHAKDTQASGEQSGLYSFVQVCVQGWEGMLDENDKEIPFSKELAFDYLADEDNSWFTAKLIEVSQDVRNYKASPAATKEADAGN
ncbi:hypothetical protein IFT54_05530 [Sphingomonas sp. CFBP 13714]|uniref:hypothetical protein n=1 Tax=Sphingomonas sp. CFBP 13714 TaxID=2775308 RepID=UPI00177B167F|nr:hypothetical protein [Sphingomonas sp. CFBP 13714]MBD8699276.1 hypothetical protein [Sphingomonas sp. CFBP 13714]